MKKSGLVARRNLVRGEMLHLVIYVSVESSNRAVAANCHMDRVWRCGIMGPSDSTTGTLPRPSAE